MHSPRYDELVLGGAFERYEKKAVNVPCRCSGSPETSVVGNSHWLYFVPLAGGTLPFYDLAAVAHAVDLDPKQLDNLLSRNHLPGIEKNRRGLARRFGPEVAVVVKLAADMAAALNLPTGKLLPLSYEVERAGRHEIAIGDFVKLEVNVAALRRSMVARLDEAVEIVGRRRRGRPPMSGHA